MRYSHLQATHNVGLSYRHTVPSLKGIAIRTRCNSLWVQHQPRSTVRSGLHFKWNTIQNFSVQSCSWNLNTSLIEGSLFYWRSSVNAGPVRYLKKLWPINEASTSFSRNYKINAAHIYKSWILSLIIFLDIEEEILKTFDRRMLKIIFGHNKENKQR